jgi:hypothetical protein
MSATLQNTTSVYHGMKGVTLSTTANTSVLNGAPDYAITYKITSIIVSNIDGTNDVDINVRWQGYTGGSAYLAKTVTVPADSTLVVLTKDTPIYMSANSQLQAWASASLDADILISYEVIESSVASSLSF